MNDGVNGFVLGESMVGEPYLYKTNGQGKDWEILYQRDPEIVRTGYLNNMVMEVYGTKSIWLMMDANLSKYWYMKGIRKI